MDIWIVAGQRLKQLIKEKGLTQGQFAEQYFMEERTVNRYCNQGINKLDIIQEFAKIFKVEPEYFIKTDG